MGLIAWSSWDIEAGTSNHNATICDFISCLSTKFSIRDIGFLKPVGMGPNVMEEAKVASLPTKTPFQFDEKLILHMKTLTRL